MKSFTFYSPTEIVFGPGAENGTVDLIRKYGGSRVLVVYGGGSVVASGLLGRIEGALREASVAYKTLGGVQPNPLLSLAREGVRQAVEFGANLILAVGGGSVIDTAKAIAHGAANPQVDIWQYWLGERNVEKSLPVGVILTISAAGSETSESSVITDDENSDKRGISTPFNRPKFAIMNPELTFTLPTYQIACGIVDIMMHTLDRYFTPTEGNEMTDQIAEALLRVTVDNGRRAMKNHSDYDAMSELMWCGSLSHNTITGLGAEVDFSPHQLGHELSAKFDVAHGASLSTMWDTWARTVYLDKPQRFARYAEKVWGITGGDAATAALAGIDATADYFRSLDMPTCFTELGIGVQSDEVLADMADRCSRNRARTIGSFRVLDRDAIYEVYKAANH